MPVNAEQIGSGRHASEALAGATAFGVLTASIGVLGLLLAGGASALIYMGRPYANVLLIFAGLASVTFLILRGRAAAPSIGKPLGDILDSAGAAVLAVGMEGRILYVNSAA